MKKIILLVMFCVSIGQAQTNLYDEGIEVTKEESRIRVNFMSSEIVYKMSLDNDSVGAGYITACNKKDGHLGHLKCTTIAKKISATKNHTFYYAPIYNSEGYNTEYAYAGFIVTEYGERTVMYLAKIKKTRYIGTDNHFYETVKLGDTGFAFLAKNRTNVLTILMPDKSSLDINEYYYNDCN